MNAAHAHLILNHIPVVGMWIGLLLLAYGMVRKNEEVTKVSLKLFIVMALISIPTFLTGEPAEEIMEHLPAFQESMVEEHETIARISTIITLILAVISAVGLFRARQEDRIPGWVITASLVLSLAGASLFGWTANIGGQIRHTEARSDFQVPASTGESGNH